MNPHAVTRDFEKAIAEYTGAPFAVAVNSCTMALLLAVRWFAKDERLGNGQTYLEVGIPKRTYVSVPMSIIHAGATPIFRDEEWRGSYQLFPLPVFDSARWFSTGMFEQLKRESMEKIGGIISDAFVCVSFHASKTLGLEQGGAILHNNPEADEWFRRMRFDGRTEGITPKDDDFKEIGYHCYMNPSTAAQGILRLHSLPRHNQPLPNDPYPDLSTMEIFK